MCEMRKPSVCSVNKRANKSITGCIGINKSQVLVSSEADHHLIHRDTRKLVYIRVKGYETGSKQVTFGALFAIVYERRGTKKESC